MEMNFCCENCGWSENVGSSIICYYNGHRTWRDECCEAWKSKDTVGIVHPEPSCEMTYITDCCCDLCGVQLIREDNFCRGCGKRIEWEGR